MKRQYWRTAGSVIGTVLMVAGLVAGCSRSDREARQAGFARKDTVTVGWIGPLSGPARLLGVDSAKAVQMAVDEYHASRKDGEPEITLLVEDDRLIAQECVSAFRKVVSEHRPDVVMLTSYSGMFLIAEDALRDGVIIVDAIDNDRNLAKLNKNVFMIAKQTEGLGAVVATALIEQGKKKALIVHFNGDDFMPTLARKVKEIFGGGGGETVIHDYPAGTSDFRSFLAAGKTADADAYIFFGYTEIGLAMRQARDMGITQSFYSVNVITDPELQANSQGAIEGTQFAHFTHLDGNTQEAEVFLSRYQQKHRAPPAVPWTALQAYDAARIIIAAAAKAARQKGDFTHNLRRNMLRTDDFEGVTGDLSIRPDGTSRGIYPSLYTLANGKAVKNSVTAQDSVETEE